MTNLNWSFYQIWNKSLETRKERRVEPRAKIWASELGQSMVDRYLKMTGVKPSNPPNARSLRKFEAGNIWEWIVGLVLKRAGILLDDQGWVEYTYPDLLPVSGRLDYLAGGKPDWDRAKTEIFSFGFPDFIMRAANDILAHLQQKYPFGMKEIVLEIKTCSSRMFEKHERLGTADTHHILQAYHYIKCKNMPEAHVVYISKDDCRMLEVGVFQPSLLEEQYRSDIEAITGYFSRRERPPLLDPIVLDEETARFSANWKVMYSDYLTMLYGFKDQAEFEGKYRPLCAQWNRVVGRMIDKKNMTKMNLDVIKEIKKIFPRFEEVVAKVGKKEDK